MGTRSLVHVIEKYEDGKEETIITMYSQWDGYLSGMGQSLYNFLKDFTIVNGIRLGEERKIANGMGCLAAQLVAHFKTEVGSIYLYPPNTCDVWEEYVYRIWENQGELFISAFGVYNDEELYSGTVSEFEEVIKESV